MIKANYADKKLIIDILTASFDKNKSVNYVAKQDKKREKRIKALMDYSFENSWETGEIFFSEDRKAVALIIYPHKKKSSFISIIRDVKVIFSVIGFKNTLKVLAMESNIKKHYPKQLAYISFIGVHPDFQRNKIGTSLLCDIIKLYDEVKLPIYLETSMPDNLRFYNKFGFQVYDELQPEHKLFMLKRDFR